MVISWGYGKWPVIEGKYMVNELIYILNAGSQLVDHGESLLISRGP